VFGRDRPELTDSEDSAAFLTANVSDRGCALVCVDDGMFPKRLNETSVPVRLERVNNHHKPHHRSSKLEVFREAILLRRWKEAARRRSVANVCGDAARSLDAVRRDGLGCER